MSIVLNNAPICTVERYALYDAIGVGGMATVHIGRLRGAAGFTRTVAIKRLHPPFARDAEFVSMFVDEARLASRIHHPNVVQTLDVVAEDGELFLVMEYVPGEALAHLMQLASIRGELIPHSVAVTIMVDALEGLHAAHEAQDGKGCSLELVHRDVSPQNIQVGTDGLARVLDFGVAQSTGGLHISQVGVAKGKLAYMAPEQIDDGVVSRQADVFGASVVLWELLTGRRLFRAKTNSQVIAKVMTGKVAPPSRVVAHLPSAYDAVVMKGLERDPAKRYSSARAMAKDLEACNGGQDHGAVARWLQELAGGLLERRAAHVARVERHSEISELTELRVMVDQLTGSRRNPIGFDVNREVSPSCNVEGARESADMVTVNSRIWRHRSHRRLRTASAAMVLAVTAVVCLVFMTYRIDTGATVAGSMPSHSLAMAPQLANAIAPNRQLLAVAVAPSTGSSPTTSSSEELPDSESRLRAEDKAHRRSTRAVASKTSTSGSLSPFRNLGGRL